MTRFIVTHPVLTLLATIILALVIHSLGDRAARRARRVASYLFWISLVVLLLDIPLYWYLGKLNPEGYGQIYPVVIALLVAPVAILSGVFLLGLKLAARWMSPGTRGTSQL
jgi:hypothetical protein